jgi:transmembrane sensor
VTLLEGKIAVKALPDGAAQLDLAAGEQVSYPMAKGKVERKAVRVDRVSAWRVRKLDFSDTPLLEAIAESNRYSDTHIELDAPELAAAEINGTFDAGKPELFAEGLSGYFHLTVTRPAHDLIVLSSQPSRNRPEQR